MVVTAKDGRLKLTDSPNLRRERRVVHLTTAHPASDPRIYLKECVSLAKAGYDTHLIATGEQPPAGNAVKVAVKTRSQRRLIRILLDPLRALSAVRRKRPDLVHLHDPELIPLGLLLKVLGTRVIYDAHEDFSAQIRSKAYLPRSLRPFIAYAGRWLTRMGDVRFDAVVAATPSIAKLFSNDRTVTVQNFPLVSEWPRPTSTVARDQKLIAYVGGVNEIRGIWPMLRTIEILRSRRDVRLEIAGPVAPSLMERLRAHPGWSAVSYHDWLSRSEVADLLGRASVGLVLFQPAPNHIESQPTKLFEYMAAGVPVVASNFPLWSEIIDGEGCGRTVDATSPEDIADAIEGVLGDPEAVARMGLAGRAAIDRRYNWSAESAKLVGLYDHVFSLTE